MSMDKIITSAPLNSTAARVTGKGVHYDPTRKPLTLQAAPDTRARENPIPCAKELLSAPAAILKSLQAQRWGRWTVIGYALQQPEGKNAKASWVVRCTCGRYETRSTKAIRRAVTSGDRCWECAHVEQVKRTYAMHGSKPLSAFISPTDGAAPDPDKGQAPQ